MNLQHTIVIQDFRFPQYYYNVNEYICLSLLDCLNCSALLMLGVSHLQYSLYENACQHVLTLCPYLVIIILSAQNKSSFHCQSVVRLLNICFFLSCKKGRESLYSLLKVDLSAC
jgi:hypothetical protein